MKDFSIEPFSYPVTKGAAANPNAATTAKISQASIFPHKDKDGDNTISPNDFNQNKANRID